MRGLLFALLLLMTALAGCADDASDADQEADTDPDGMGDGAATEDEDGTAGAPRTEGNLSEVRLNLHGDGSLSTTEPTADRIEMVGLSAMTTGADMSDAEYATEEFGVPMYIPPQTIEASVWVETNSLAVGNPAFDMAIWVGSSRGELDVVFRAITFAAAGEPQEVTVSFDLTERPDFVLPAGESLTMRVLGAYQPEEGGQQFVVVGPDTPTGFTVKLQPQFTEVPAEAPVAETFTGTVNGGTFATCEPTETTHTFTVAEDATIIDLVLSARSPASGEDRIDVDLDLMDGTTLVWHAGSPYPREEILLTGKAVEPYRGTDIQVRASICLGGTAEYEINVHQGIASEP